MRNLKRALSLALAFVMVMSLMIVGTSAKSYTDSDKIENQAAVEILGEIGVMVGNDDGSFAPDRVVTRAEMAVIITRVLYGNNLNVEQFKGLNTFTDVPDWAEGYVNLCASLDIIAGRGNGIFDPDATVTTAEAALMLSRVLGYFKNNAEFGNDWALAAVKRATQAGIIGGDMVLAANDGLTRDDVAQMTFNTLTNAVPVQYNELLDVYYNENQGIIYALEFNYLQTLGYKNFSLVYKTNENTIYGRPATTWGIGSYNVPGSGTASGIEKAELTDDGGLIASNVRMLDKDQIITVENTPDYVYDNSTEEKDVYADLGATVCNATKDADYTWTVYINGEEQNLDEDDMIPAKSSDAKYDFTDKGSVTEIYIDDYDQTVTVVEINYYLGQVSKVDEENDTITVKELSNEPKLDDDKFATTEFAEDDYVVFTVDYNDDDDFYICELMAPETVTGDVTRVQNNANSKNFDKYNSYVRLNGEDTKYYYTALATHMCYDVSEDGKDEHPTLNEEYIFYMTPAGYILGFQPTEVTVDQYLYVNDSDEELKDWVAKVFLPDATEPKIDLKDDLKSVEGNVEYVDEADTGALVEYEDANDDKVVLADEIEWVQNKDVNGENRTNIDNRIWKYSVNDSGVYTLTWVENYVLGADAAADGKDFTAEIKNGKAYITDGDNDLIVDQKTIFVDTMNNVAYTGYDEVPNVDNALVDCVVDDGVASIVFILAGDIYDVNATYFMLTSLDRDSAEDGDAGEYWIYDDAYVNGANTQMQITYNAVEELTGDEDGQLETGVLYKATKTIEDGEFIDEIEEVGTYNGLPYNFAEYTPDANYDEYEGVDNFGKVYSVGDNAFWLADEDYDPIKDKTVKFDTDDETVYVTVRAIWTLNSKGELVFDSWKIDDGKISDLKAIDNEKSTMYSDKWVHVVSRVDDETARLVYIFWAETEIDPVEVNFSGDFANTTVTFDGSTVYGDTVVNKHSDVDVEITPDNGYRLTKVTLNGVAQTIDKDGTCSFTISDITKAATIAVETESYTMADVTVSDANNLAVVKVNGAAIDANGYETGSDVTITVQKSADATKDIAKVTVGDVELTAVGGVYTYTGKMPAGGLTVTVVAAEPVETVMDIKVSFSTNGDTTGIVGDSYMAEVSPVADGKVYGYLTADETKIPDGYVLDDSAKIISPIVNGGYDEVIFKVKALAEVTFTVAGGNCSGHSLTGTTTAKMYEGDELTFTITGGDWSAVNPAIQSATSKVEIVEGSVQKNSGSVTFTVRATADITDAETVVFIYE